jgi:hypothetical protein
LTFKWGKQSKMYSILEKTGNIKCPLTGEWIDKMWYVCTMD